MIRKPDEVHDLAVQAAAGVRETSRHARRLLHVRIRSHRLERTKEAPHNTNHHMILLLSPAIRGAGR